MKVFYGKCSLLAFLMMAGFTAEKKQKKQKTWAALENNWKVGMDKRNKKSSDPK